MTGVRHPPVHEPLPAGFAPAVAGDRRAGRAMQVVQVLAATLLAACGTGTNGTTSQNQSPVLQRGAEVYAASCAACHGERGQGRIGPALGGGRVAMRYPDPADHRSVVVKGRRGMPAFGGTLSDRDIDAVVRFERERLGR